MQDFGVLGERALEQSDALGTIARARDGNPEIFSAGAMILVEVGEQRGAGNGPYVAVPAFSEQGSQGPAGVVGGTGAEQKYWAGSGPGVHSGTREKRLQCRDLVEAALIGNLPAFGLLGNFPGSKQEPALDSFCFRQIQQCTQGFVQLKSPSSKATSVYYKYNLFEKHSQQIESGFGRKRQLSERAFRATRRATSGAVTGLLFSDAHRVGGERA